MKQMKHDAVLNSLRKHGDFSDLTVTCGERQFNTHKCVVCKRSGWFDTACREQRWKEGQEGCIHLEAITASYDEEEQYECDHPEAVRLMMDYIYTGDYTPVSKPPLSDNVRGLCFLTEESREPSKSDEILRKYYVSAAPTSSKSGIKLERVEDKHQDHHWHAEPNDPEPYYSIPKRSKKKGKRYLTGPEPEPAPSPAPAPEPELAPADPAFAPAPDLELAPADPAFAPAPEPEPAPVNPEVPPPSTQATPRVALSTSTFVGPLAMHARIYALGAKYQVYGLQNFVAFKLKAAFSDTWEKDDFAAAIIIAYGSTSPYDSVLRNIFTDTILENSRMVVEEACIEEAIKSIDGLGYELFKRESLKGFGA